MFLTILINRVIITVLNKGVEIMTDYNRISKATARELHHAGKEFLVVPRKLNPANRFFAMGSVIDKAMFPDFDKICNTMQYYNCNYETGYYLAFYTVTE